MKGQFTKPIGYIEEIGGYVIKKIYDRGKKYIVWKGAIYWRFANIQQARKFATERIQNQQLKFL